MTPSTADLRALDFPVLRLTGGQIDSIEPPPEGDWFIDYDEYEEYVPLPRYLALLDRLDKAEAARERLREALSRIGDGECLNFGNGFSCLNGNEPTLCATCSAIAALTSTDKETQK
jgi:hypothetical protein